MAIEIYPHAWPIQPRRHLLDMGRFAGAVIAGNHDAPIPGEACKDGERRRLIETVIRVDIWSMLVRLRVSGNLHVGIDAEQLADRHLHIREAGDLFCYGGH
jgi:hypothetical protein